MTETQELFSESQNPDSQYEENSKAWGRLIGISPRNGSNFFLKENVHSIGRGSANDFVIDHMGISGRHCTITRETISGSKSNDFLVWLEDLSTNGTYVDNEKIGKGKKKLLHNGNMVHLLKAKGQDVGNISFVFHNCCKEEAEMQEEGSPFQKYQIRHVLGTGNFAVVKFAIHKDTGASYAIKIIDKKKFKLSNATKRKNTLHDEVEILSKIKHPNIIGIQEIFETETTLYIVLELVTGGELFDKILKEDQIPEDEAKSYFKQMLEAIKYLHDQGIAHRDLKPENILLKNETTDIIKISDFGLSRVVDQQSFMKTICGTPQYVAPEILQCAKTDGYGTACDLCWLAISLLTTLNMDNYLIKLNQLTSIFQKNTGDTFLTLQNI